MKLVQRSFLLVIGCLLASTLLGQTVSKRIYIVEEFTKGTVLFTNKSITTTELNYDAANGEMLYYDKEELMVLPGNPTIESVTIGDHVFIPIARKFMERIELAKGEAMYIDWRLKPSFRGKKGAYGQVSQTANVDHINRSHWVITDDEVQTSDVFSISNTNEYWFYKEEKPVKFKDQKSLLKHFPDQADTIKAYIKTKKLNLKNTADVVALLDYVLNEL